MIAFIWLLGAIGVVLCVPGWVWIHRRGRLYLGDLLPPIVMPVVWFYLSSAGLGAQSLANLIEVPVLAGAAIGLVYLRALLEISHRKPKTASLALVIASIALPVLSRLLTPMMPE